MSGMVTGYEEVPEPSINHGPINHNLSLSQIETRLGTVNLANNSVFFFAVYEEAGQVYFVNEGSTIYVEQIQLQFYVVKERVEFVRINVLDYLRQEEANYTDLIQDDYTVMFDDGFGYINIHISVTNVLRRIVIDLLGERLFFKHISQEKNQYFDETLTQLELWYEFLTFGFWSVLISLGGGLGGVKIDEKAREIPLDGKGWTFVIAGLSSFLTLVAVLQLSLGQLIVNRLIYYFAVAVLSVVIGIKVNTVEFIEYLGRQTLYKKGKAIWRNYEVKLYRISEKQGAEYALAWEGFWEAIRRLLNFHIVFILEATHSIKAEGYHAAYELESAGWGAVNSDGKRTYEWVTVSDHKLPSRLVSDNLKKVQYLDKAYQQVESENNDLKSTREHEVSRRVGNILESHYSKMGLNLHVTKSISDETLKLAAKLQNRTKEEIEADINDEVEYYEKHKKTKSRLSGVKKKFKGVRT